MTSFNAILKNVFVENWFSFVVLIVLFLFLMYNYRLQDTLLTFRMPNDTIKVRPRTISNISNIIQCSKPGCVRCRARAKEEMLMEIRRRMEDIVTDAGGSQNGISGRLQKSFDHQLTVTTNLNHETEHDLDDRDFRQNPSMFYLQQLSRKYSYEHLNDFPNYGELLDVIRSCFIDVREEFDVVWKDFVEGSNVEGWQENSLSEGKWFTFHLMNQGKRQRDNMQRCPKTSEMLDTLEPLMVDCIFGFATFSVVMPGTHIESHCGATNVRLRCHLGLHIPEGCCSLTVNGEILHWRENECLVFDDSFLHEAEHNGNEFSDPRSVLLLDIWHPSLSSEEKKMLEYVFHSDVLQS